MNPLLRGFLTLLVFGLATAQPLRAANITLEPESGQLNAPATKGSDSNAFGGKFIYLGQWPNSANTGVLAVYDETLGRKLQYSDLTPLSGLIRIDDDWVSAHGNTRIVEKLDITGSLVVLTANVTVRRCRITGSSSGSVVTINWGYGGLAGIVFEDLEITNNVESGICADAIIRRCYLHNLAGDGAWVGTNSILEDTCIMALYEFNGSHNDGVQTGGGNHMVIRHNRIENPVSQTSCIMLAEDFGLLSDVLVEGNLLDGGGYTVYGGTDATYVRFLNNRFGRTFRPNGGYYGPEAYYYPANTGNQWLENVWDDTGAAITP